MKLLHNGSSYIDNAFLKNYIYCIDKCQHIDYYIVVIVYFMLVNYTRQVIILRKVV